MHQLMDPTTINHSTMTRCTTITRVTCIPKKCTTKINMPVITEASMLKRSVPKVQVGNGYPNDAVLHQRTTEARRLEIPGNEKQIPIDLERIPVKETHHLRESVHSTAEPKIRSYHYVRPNSELRDQILEKGNQNNKYQQQYDHVVPAINPTNPESDRINKYRQHYELSEPRRPLPHHHHLSASQPVKYDPSLQHSFTSAGQSSLQSPRHPMTESQFHHQPRKVNRHRHFLINPHHQQGVGSHLHQESHRPHQHAQSKPYLIMVGTLR
ncbi:hypothetical protein CEXT_563791 [Caerostris extrusa]|uniref:Uncharacterized protein n=1 Tax=Caerostris extrusa TaxID=172846 RepID=A0AAV4SVS6_CAEEX|nr:hypothetical protein CEXT_563791 [Caerostris extrusa]